MRLKNYFLYANVLILIGLLGGCYKTGCDFAASPKTEWKTSNLIVASKACPESLNNKDGAVSLVDDVELDIAMLMDIAFENSPSTHRAWQMSKIAAAKRGQACSIFLPVIKIAGVSSHSSVEELDYNGNLSHNTVNAYYPSVEIAMSVFQFGAHVNTANAAKNALYAANFQYNRSLQTLFHDVQVVYFDFDSAMSNVEANEKNIADAKCALDSAEIKFNVGLTNLQDFLQAKANFSSAVFELEKAKSNVEIARANLSKIIGMKVSSKIKIYRADEPKMDENFLRKIDDLIDDSLKSRPDILSAYSEFLSKKSIESTKQSQFLPEVIIGFNGDKKRIRNVSDKLENYTAFVKIQWEVFNGFRDTYAVLEAQAAKEKARQELRSVELTVAADVWTSYHTFKSCIQQLAAAKNLLQTSQEAFDAMSIGYKNGLARLNDILSAQHQLAQARTSYVAAKNNLSKSIVELSYATGDLISPSTINKR